MDRNFTDYFFKNGWTIKDQAKSARKLFIFQNFKDAFSWMTSMAITSEKYDHHPEWKNVYNNVEVHLITHDIGELSDKDLELAKSMDKEFERYS